MNYTYFLNIFEKKQKANIEGDLSFLEPWERHADGNITKPVLIRALPLGSSKRELTPRNLMPECLHIDRELDDRCFPFGMGIVCAWRQEREIHSWPILNLFISIQFSHSVVSNSLRPYGLQQYIRPPCPSPAPGVYSNSCPLSQCCHPPPHPLSSPSPPTFILSQH